MTDRRFDGLSDEELSDIWYALAGAEIRHPDRFFTLVDASIRELEQRRGAEIRRFLDERFAPLRATDAREDAAITRNAARNLDTSGN